MKANQIGTVDKIKVIKTFPDMLITFTLITNRGDIECRVLKSELAKQLLFLEDGQTDIACFGTVIHNNQLIIQKMTIRNPTSYIMTFAMKA